MRIILNIIVINTAALVLGFFISTLKIDETRIIKITKAKNNFARSDLSVILENIINALKHFEKKIKYYKEKKISIPLIVMKINSSNKKLKNDILRQLERFSNKKISFKILDNSIRSLIEMHKKSSKQLLTEDQINNLFGEKYIKI